MTRQEKIEDCDLLIAACGKAWELAELASDVKRICEYHNIKYEPFYNSLKTEVIMSAGIADDEHEVLDEVITKRYGK